MRVGSLFAGMGGFDDAAKVVGWRTAWVSEVADYPSKLLAAYYPDAPNHGDITQIDFTQVEPVEVLCGGFPCQDISKAGSGDGIAGGRSGLWSYYARAIGDLRPRWVVVENVAVLTRRGLGHVLGDLSTLGYDAWWECVPASFVGAPHGRDRVWLCAHPERAVADPDRLGQVHRSFVQFATEARLDAQRHAGTSGPPLAYGHWAIEPGVGRLADGVPDREERIACLGNAVCPQIPELIFRAIQNCEDT